MASRPDSRDATCKQEQPKNSGQHCDAVEYWSARSTDCRPWVPNPPVTPAMDPRLHVAFSAPPNPAQAHHPRRHRAGAHAATGTAHRRRFRHACAATRATRAGIHCLLAACLATAIYDRRLAAGTAVTAQWHQCRRCRRHLHPPAHRSRDHRCRHLPPAGSQPLRRARNSLPARPPSPHERFLVDGAGVDTSATAARPPLASNACLRRRFPPPPPDILPAP